MVYINAEKFIDSIMSEPSEVRYPVWYAEKARQMIVSPDTIVVKHGRWIKTQLPLPLSDSSKDCVECSVCHTHWETGNNYCPYCGAKMDEVTE